MGGRTTSWTKNESWSPPKLIDILYFGSAAYLGLLCIAEQRALIRLSFRTFFFRMWFSAKKSFFSAVFSHKMVIIRGACSCVYQIWLKWRCLTRWAAFELHPNTHFRAGQPPTPKKEGKWSLLGVLLLSITIVKCGGLGSNSTHQKINSDGRLAESKHSRPTPDSLVAPSSNEMKTHQNCLREFV